MKIFSMILLAVSFQSIAEVGQPLGNYYDRDNDPVERYIAGHPVPPGNPLPPNDVEIGALELVAQHLGVDRPVVVVYRNAANSPSASYPFSTPWRGLFQTVYDICATNSALSNYSIGCTRGYTLRSNVVLMIQLDDRGVNEANDDTRFGVGSGAYPAESLKWVVPRCQNYDMRKFASIAMWEMLRARLGLRTSAVNDRYPSEWQSFETLYGNRLNEMNVSIGC